MSRQNVPVRQVKEKMHVMQITDVRNKHSKGRKTQSKEICVMQLDTLRLLIVIELQEQ